MKKFVLLLAAFAACAAILPVAAAVDITVNGVNVSTGSGSGWTSSSTGLSLTNAGPFTISGNNNGGQFNINPLADCTIVATNLTIDDSGSSGSALYIGGNPYHVTLLLAGTNTFAGGSRFAGVCIERGSGSLTISNQEAAAALVVRGGQYGAGIGGNNNGAGGTVTISGGTVTATGGGCGAGIGGGYGCGGGTVTISGGTVLATRGNEWYQDIGGWVSATSGTNTFTGGSIILTNDSISQAPQNGTAPVNCVRFYGAPFRTWFADLTNELARLSPAYGVKDITCINNSVCAWLPNGTYDFVIAGAHYPFTVADAATTVLVSPLVGVTVDGLDAVYGVGAGWTYDGTNLAFTGNGPFVVSGANGTNTISIRARADCTVVASNLAVNVSAFNLPAFAVGTHGVTLVLAGANSLVGGGDGAGVSVTGGALVITNLDAAASLYAKGGDFVADVAPDGGSISVGGSTTSGGGAGIGGGVNEAGGTVTIAGGIVTAVGGQRTDVDSSSGISVVVGGGAGIGGGYNGTGGKVTISGGTVVADGGLAANDIGSAKGGTNTFIGGSIALAYGKIVSAPSNGTARVWRVTVTGLVANAAVTLSGPDVAGYGQNDIHADAEGKVHLWLPNGNHRFSVNGQPERAVVAGAAVTAEPGTLLGLTVDGVDLFFSTGAGWTYDGTNLAFTGNGPFVVSGTNGTNAVSIRADGDCTVVASNLAVDVSDFNLPAFAIGTSSVTLVLAGANRLRGGGDCAGIAVTGGAGSLVVSNLDAAASLYAQGGSTLAGTGTTGGGAGIGGGLNEAGGTVTIAGGIVTAAGGERGQTDGMLVSITGYGAGIGGGFGGAGGTVTVSGGTVEADGGMGAAGIGYGTSGAKTGTNTFTGGSIVPVTIVPAPSNGVARAWCVTVPVGQAGPVNLTGPRGYGTNGIVADDKGKVYLWLPDGDYRFGINGQPGRAVVAGAAVTAELGTFLGLTVNGTDFGCWADAGWTYDGTNLALTGAGPYVISGTNGTNAVSIRADVDCTVVASNLAVDVSAFNLPAFAIGTNTATLVLAGTNRLRGGGDCAGIGVIGNGFAGGISIAGEKTGTLTIRSLDDSAASLEAQGGNAFAGAGTTGGGAGIGGGVNEPGGTVTILGGIVTASGGSRGQKADGMSENVDGYGAGIGGGFGGAGGTVNIVGGTVSATGHNSAADIGPGYGASVVGVNTFRGGSILLKTKSASPAPENGSVSVYCVTVAGLAANARQVVVGLPAAYGVNGIYADTAGKIYLWLPDGTYAFGVNGQPWRAVVAGAATSAVALTPVGVTVNGTDAAYGAGPGWTFAAPGLSLTNAGPFVIGGDNQGNPFTINPLADCVIVATNLTIDNSSTNGSALYIGTNSSAVTLLLAGTNTLAGGKGKAGVCIESGPGALVISNRDEAATLVARGGNDAAGIGGGSQGTGGKVTIAGGRIVATGAGGGAGIGGGTYRAGGAVTITGGRIAATGGVYGAGIGGGYAAAGGTVTISGGTVLATRGSQYYHDIGGFTGAAAGAVTLIGGSVHLLNGSVALAPSNGAERVWCVTNGGFTANAPVSLDLSGSYGTDGIYADASGNVYLWLPAGEFVEGGVSTDGATTNAVLQGFGVSAAGAVTGPTNVELRITGVSTNGITGWTPDVLSAAHVETIYATNLTDTIWSPDRPTNTPAVFMKLRVR